MNLLKQGIENMNVNVEAKNGIEDVDSWSFNNLDVKMRIKEVYNWEIEIEKLSNLLQNESDLSVLNLEGEYERERNMRICKFCFENCMDMDGRSLISIHCYCVKAIKDMYPFLFHLDCLQSADTVVKLCIFCGFAFKNPYNDIAEIIVEHNNRIQ